jgi:hypothetical protein
VPTRRLGLIAIALFAGPAAGQTTPILATITADEVVTRGQPRADAADTGTLARGASVIVHHEEGDKWLAIQPPRGAVSWVNHLFVEITDPVPGTFFQNAVVHVDQGGQVRLAAGKPGVNHPFDVRLAAVPAGTVLRVIGPKAQSPDDNSTWWYPIEPPEDDFRYIPKDAVRTTGPAKATFVVNSPPPPDKPRLTVDPGPASIPSPGVPGKPAGWPTNATWAQAEAALQAGDLDKAEKLYFQLAKDMNAPGGDADLANLCYTRIHSIRERKQATGPGTNRTTSPDRPVTTTTSTRPEPKDAVPPRTEAAAPNGAQWTGAGYLRPAAFKVNGKPAFALEDSRNRVVMYAVPSAGVDLDKLGRRNADLYGTVQYLPDLRGVGLMTVTKAEAMK